MGGRDQIKAGLERTEVGTKAGFETRLTNAENRAEAVAARVEQVHKYIGQEAVFRHEQGEELKSTVARVDAIEDADKKRAASARSLQSYERFAVSAFGLMSVGLLAYFKVIGLIAVSFSAIFIPALAVALTYVAFRWLTDSGYAFFRVLVGALAVTALLAPIAALILVGIVIYLGLAIIKPLRGLSSKFLKAWEKSWARFAKKTEERLKPA